MNNVMGYPRLLLYSTIFLTLHACGGGGGGGGNDIVGGDTGGGDVNGTYTLSWQPPSTRTDNSFLPLSSIAGYRIYYGIDENDLQLHTDIIDGTMNNVTVTVMDITQESNKIYFGITAYDIYNLESEMSNIKSIDGF